MSKPQLDHTEECILLAMLEVYPLTLPDDRIVDRAHELSGLLADEYAQEEQRIINRQSMLLSPN